MNPLSSWLVLPPSTRTIARRAEGDVTTEAFLSDVADLAHVIALHGRGRWLLSTEGAYDCAVGLFALWQEDSTAVLSPNREAGSLRELSVGVKGILSDRPLAGEESAQLPVRVSILGGPRAARPGWRELDRNEARLELCTSGSTGARKLVLKSLAQLESEIEELEREFGVECGSGAVFGTVSHQHVYGLLFRVLWPLAAGRTFFDAPLSDPSHLAGALAAQRGAILVSSPAHLKRLPGILDLARLLGECGPVFSSGGPLDALTARIYATKLLRAPIEVLGSTETGGIAWRRQDGSESVQYFTPFAGVDVEAKDGLLHVRSPRTGSMDLVPTGDAIELAEDGRIRLLGRADRIVKLFDERVSLSEIEARLGAHPLVEAAAALVLERNDTARIAVAVVLSSAGEHARTEGGRPALIALLRAQLEPFCRPTVLPRTWRFVARLPQDEQGKIPRPLLEALFAECVPTRSARVTREAVASARQFEVELEVPHDLWCLRGHFDGFPIVPGVVQLGWVIEWGTTWIGREPRLRAIEGLKFKQVLSGGTRFRLALERVDDGSALRFRLWNESAEFSSGRLHLCAGEA
ncbi:MAG: hypothetical protein EXS08_15095 [Planctomycetes bacterium]|nr:hypothetical protein [Planctomycetota bacterium]